MVGKVFLLAAVAVVCVSFAQVRGDETPLESAIRRGVQRAESINRDGQRRIDAAINEASYKKKLLESKTSEFIQKAENVQDSFQQTLGRAAEAIREKAREGKKPPSVIECVDRVEENAVKTVEGLTKKFKDDMERLERVKGENVDTYAKPLLEMTDALKVRFERAVSIIRECKNPQCVDIAINSFLNWLDLLFSEMTRIRNQINTALTNYQRDASTFFTNTNRQITRIRGASLRNVNLCIRNKEVIFGQH